MLTNLTVLISHVGFIRYLKNTGWMMGEQFLRIIAGLFVGIWVARYLGPEQFGLFSYVLAFTAIFSGIAKLGLDGIMVRELVNHHEKRDTYLGTAFWLKIFGAFLVMGLMAAIVPLTSNDARTNLFIFIIAAGLVFQSFEVVEFYFQSQVLAKIVAICKVIQLALSSMIKIYLVLNEAELFWFVLVTAFDALSLAVSYFIAYILKNNSAFYKHFDFSIAKRLVKDSWPLIFSAIVVMLYMRIDQIMIKEILGEYEVGIYSAAVRLSEIFYFIPVVITASLFPALLNAKKRSEEEYYERLQKLYDLMVVISVALALSMTFLSTPIVTLLFSEAYLDSGLALSIHIWASIFVFLGVANGKWFLIENLQKLMMIRAVYGVFLNVLFNFILIPLFSVYGAALGTLITAIFVNFVIDIVSVKTRDIFLMKLRSFNFIGIYSRNRIRR